jgi:hypothetical protein
MIGANIYSSFELEPQTRNILSDGLSIVGQYVGGISILRFNQLTMKTNTSGETTTKVACTNFDPAVALHIFAHPLKGFHEKKRLGVAYSGSGVSHVDTRSSASALPIVVAHEVAHSLGFVLPDSPQTALVSRGHCGDIGCIMHERYRDDIARDDFCTPCKADMRDMVQPNLLVMRTHRMTHGAVLTKDQVEKAHVVK